MLESIGYKVDAAENGKQALAMCASDDYDLILLDIRLPDISGIDVATEIRRLENGKKRIPIVAVTVFSLDYIEDKCLSAGMDRVITKPVKSDSWEPMIASFAA